MQSKSQISAHNLEIEAPHAPLTAATRRWWRHGSIIPRWEIWTQPGGGPPKQQIPHQIKVFVSDSGSCAPEDGGFHSWTTTAEELRDTVGRDGEKSIWVKETDRSISKCGRCVQDSSDINFPSDFLHWRPTIGSNNRLRAGMLWLKSNPLA